MRSAKWMLAATALLLGACAEGEFETLEKRQPEEIYKLAESYMQNGSPETAARYFSELERLYPYSDWAKRGMVMAAFAYHTLGNYEESRASADRFLSFYPADEDAAYAQYIKALSFYDQIGEVGRDQGNTLDAMQSLRSVIERYPNSEYARSASLKFDLAFDHLASKEMEVGRFYLKRGNYAAAVNRFRTVVEEFETTSHTPEALHRLVETYLLLGLVQEAQTAGAILGHNFQDSDWYRDSYELLANQGLEPSIVGDNWLARFYRQVIRGRWL